MLSFELTKDTPYLALSGELWSVFYEYFNRNWPCYKGFLLYWPSSQERIKFLIFNEAFQNQSRDNTWAVLSNNSGRWPTLCSISFSCSWYSARRARSDSLKLYVSCPYMYILVSPGEVSVILNTPVCDFQTHCGDWWIQYLRWDFLGMDATGLPLRLTHWPLGELDSLTHWSTFDFKNAIFNLVLLIGICRSSCDNALRWMSQELDDDLSTLVQVMAWCLSQGRHRSLSPYGVTWPQWVNDETVIQVMLTQFIDAIRCHYGPTSDQTSSLTVE